MPGAVAAGGSTLTLQPSAPLAEDPQLAPRLERLHRDRERVAFAVARRRRRPDDAVGAAARERRGRVVLRVDEQDAGLARLARRRDDSDSRRAPRRGAVRAAAAQRDALTRIAASL